jgi:glycosyltransferase involved in cell wall biosynthesis
MRIVYDVSYIQKHRAGYGRFSYDLLAGLLENDTANSYILNGWSASLDLEALRNLAGNRARLSVATIPGQIKRFHRNTLQFPSLEFFTGAFDIFHGVEPLLPPVGKRKAIATIYDLAYRRFPKFFEANVLGWDTAVKRSLLRADAIIVPSEQTKADVVEMFGAAREKIHIVRLHANGIFHPSDDVTKDEAILRKHAIGEPYALFVGTLEPRKNIPSLIKAFEHFHKSGGKEFQLVIAGKKGWLYEPILSAIKESPAASHIRRLDYVSERDLAALYSRARMFMYPSLFEGYGFPVLEAMASGTPVITSNNSSLAEIGHDAALLINPERVDEIADAMARLTTDESLRARLIAAGIARAAEISTSNAVASVLNIYKSLA